MAMSVVARGKIRAALEGRADSGNVGDRIVMAARRRIRKRRSTVSCCPFGGYKGYGLALVVDLLAGVSLGRLHLTHVNSWLDDPQKPGNLGHFFLLVDTRVLGPTDWLAQRMADFDAIVHGTPRADPSVPVRCPEIELERLERHRRDGVAMDARLIARLEALAAR